MRTSGLYRRGRRRGVGLLWLGLAGWLGAAAPVWAAAPLVPIPVPDYSFDRDSCAVDGGLFAASDVLVLEFPDPDPVLTGMVLGLFSEDDDLDALSGANAGVGTDAGFVLLFSVDALSAGVAPPAAELVELNVPYNVADQAMRGHASADQFMSTCGFTIGSGISGAVYNNVLTRNNFDEGGVDFAAAPPTSAHDMATFDGFDVLDATAWLTREGATVVSVYYSVTGDSPSLVTLPVAYNLPSGADIYYSDIPVWLEGPDLYAAHTELGLVEDDDIDAVVVFDLDENRSFNGTDRVLFSLAPGSPSLTTIVGASETGAAADIFVAVPGAAAAVLASAAELGLGNALDNIDALEIYPCGDPLEGAALHGIRSPRGDVNCDGRIDYDDIDPLVAALACPGGGVACWPASGIPPECPWLRADCNGDGTVNYADVDVFVGLLTGH